VKHICLALVLSAGVAVGAERTVRDPVADFQHRAQLYVQLHERVKKTLPKLKDETSPEKIIAHEQALAAAIRKSRPAARHGSIITPAAKKHLAAILAAELKGPANKEERATAKTGNPEFPTTTDPEVKDIKMSVNATYPKDAPVSTMPPSVLLKLPKLPELLEYRFVGRDLILRDTVANIIVDFAVGVAPL
jgi:hypothetical protein